MEYVNLGRTGLKVSRICLGVMSYGSKTWRQWVLEEEEARPFLRRALDLGINFFDSADVYSLGESERILGKCLKGTLAQAHLPFLYRRCCDVRLAVLQDAVYRRCGRWSDSHLPLHFLTT